MVACGGVAKEGYRTRLSSMGLNSTGIVGDGATFPSFAPPTHCCPRNCGLLLPPT